MRRVLVTGGSRGIGAAIVEKFTKQGDKVVFIYKSNEDAAEAMCVKTGAFCIKADISDAESLRSAYCKAYDAMGGVDILVSNAGISHVAQICDVTADDW
ncbi:MAG: SDR family NAD(P)-dependent oxidoreductase, partial [Ruminococcus sp.]|nr:SDR family NAD(P)-dependent oxidoreductase [Ruminococcus sp.]